MLFLLVQLYGILQLCHNSVYAGTHKAGLNCVFYNLCMLALFSADNRSKNLHFTAVRPGHNCIDNLIYRLFTDFAATVRTVGMTGSCKKQAVVVVYFCDCTNSRARIFISRFLFNRNSRRKPFNQVNIRLVHAAKKLACIAGKTLHITPLPFCKKRIKSQRRFSRPAEPRNYNKLIPR